MKFNVLKTFKNLGPRLLRKKEDKNYVIRRGVSQQVLDAADRMIKEYQSDLDYLKDR